MAAGSAWSPPLSTIASTRQRSTAPDCRAAGTRIATNIAYGARHSGLSAEGGSHPAPHAPQAVPPTQPVSEQTARPSRYERRSGSVRRSDIATTSSVTQPAIRHRCQKPWPPASRCAMASESRM